MKNEDDRPVLKALNTWGRCAWHMVITVIASANCCLSVCEVLGQASHFLSHLVLRPRLSQSKCPFNSLFSYHRSHPLIGNACSSQPSSILCLKLIFPFQATFWAYPIIPYNHYHFWTLELLSKELFSCGAVQSLIHAHLLFIEHFHIGHWILTKAEWGMSDKSLTIPGSLLSVRTSSGSKSHFLFTPSCWQVTNCQAIFKEERNNYSTAT